MKWLVLWSLWAARLVRQPTLTLQLTNGPVRGSVAPDGSHLRYTGIPYATVTQKFQKPGPEPKWENVFEAINENVRCVQGLADIWQIGSQNCLILNLYTPPNMTPNSKVPVMVFIHGGGYYKGSSNTMMFGPKYLVQKNVILITFNYRLHAQGFICLRIKEAPGNAAMKDQVAVLKWIQRNIQQFGGDPDNITIFGESAGAASVSYHIYSPMSKGLFHKAITESGSALAGWAFTYRPVNLASLVAKTMSYESQDPYELFKFLNSKSDADIVLNRVPRQPGNLIISESIYSPCAEKIIEGEEAFFTMSPYDVLTSGEYNKVPVMIGTNYVEGLIIFAIDNLTMIPNIKFERSLPTNLEFSTEKEKLQVAQELENIYMKGEKISIDTSTKVAIYLGEIYFNFPAYEETELLLKSNEKPIYNYIFQYSGNRNFPSLILPSHLQGIKGASHADELFYLFSQDLVPNLFENKMIEDMTTMWTNFAKYGDPTPDFTNPPVKWHRTNSSTPTSLVIDSQFSTVPLWFNERVKYIKELYSKYRRKK